MIDKLEKRRKFLTDFANFVEPLEDVLFLRKYDVIEQSSVSDDIDLLVRPEVFKKLERFFQSCAFKKRVDSHLVNVYLYGSRPHVHFINEELDLHFDCISSIIHRSLHTTLLGDTIVNYWVPIDKTIQNLSYDGCVSRDTPFGRVRTLSNEVELVHILSHVILDKKGIVDDYYRKRVVFLMRNSDQGEVLSLLELVFFRFSNALIRLVQEKNGGLIYENYIKFKRY